MHRGARLIIFGFAWIGLAQAQTDWRFAHPNADMRMSVNVQSVLNAPAVTGMLRQKEQPAQVQPVLELLSSVERISISAQKTGKDQDVLALVTGSFDPSTVQALFPSRGASQVKLVGSRTILIGEGESFTQAVQRMAGEAPAGPAGELDQSDIWIAGSSALMSSPQTAPVAPAFQAMRKFSFGLNLGDSPVINVVLNADGADGAAQMLSALREMLGPLGQALETQQDGAKVKLHFPLSPEMIRFAQSQAAGMLGLPK